LQLFVRHQRSVTLTEAGKRYHQRISDIFTQIEQATKAVRQQEVEGILTLTAPHSFIHHWLIPRIESLSKTHPGLQLSLLAQSELVSFHDTQADIGIRFGTGKYPNLHTRALMKDEVTVLAPTSLLNDKEDARAETLLSTQTLLEDSSVLDSEPWNGWQAWLQESGVQRKSSAQRIQFSDSTLALNACVQGLGLCIGRRSISAQFLLDRQVQAILPWRTHEFAYYLVMHPAEVENPRIAAFTSWLLMEVEKDRRK